MTRGKIDHTGLDGGDLRRLRALAPPADMPFGLAKISHVVLKVADLERAVDFYTQVLGFRISDAYPDSMMPGRMVFLRCTADHHGIALIGGADGVSENRELHHLAFEVADLDDLFRARDHLKRHGVAIEFEGRRRAGQQVALEFRDPDGHGLELCWGMDQIGPAEAARPPDDWRTAGSLEEAVANPPPGQIAPSDRSLPDE